MGAIETATLAGGCFWCLEAVFERLRGVERVVSGYSGGRQGATRYEDVCSGSTGHAEVTQVTFDPAALTYRDLLEVFFAFHDPTTRDRQGADVGTQYRSAIFPQTAEQRDAAERVKARVEASGKWKRPITTSIEPPSTWYSAEGYHQDYLRKHPGGYSCHFMRD
jgi:methionine-S-sulfoxide reductase